MSKRRRRWRRRRKIGAETVGKCETFVAHCPLIFQTPHRSFWQTANEIQSPVCRSRKSPRKYQTRNTPTPVPPPPLPIYPRETLWYFHSSRKGEKNRPPVSCQSAIITHRSIRFFQKRHLALLWSIRGGGTGFEVNSNIISAIPLIRFDADQWRVKLAPLSHPAPPAPPLFPPPSQNVA